MKIQKDVNLEDFEAWSGARDTLNQLIKFDKCEVVEDYINEFMPDATETEVNEFLWFEDDFIAVELLQLTIDEFYK